MEKLISLIEASKMSPYSADYLSLLIRKKRLAGVKKEGKWFTTKEALDEYLQKVAEASYMRQETLNVKIPAAENRKALINLKWAIALAVVVIVSFALWGIGNKKVNQDFTVEKDANNNLIIHADDPSSIGSVTVVPK
jgi:hypothetical protein